MDRPELVVRSLFEHMQRRDWEAAGGCLSPDVRIEWTATGERFVGDAFLAMNRAYPDGWEIEVVDSIGGPERVAANVRVAHGGDVFWCAGFYTVRDGRIVDGMEHWVTERSETPPAWRAGYATG